MLQSSHITLNKLDLHGGCFKPCPAVDAEAIALSPRQVLRVESSRSTRRIRCSRGTVWITVEGSPLDLILGSGETVDLPVNGLALAEALADSSIEVVPGG